MSKYNPTREEIVAQSTANCRLCKETPIPTNFGSPRLCAFNEDGTFTDNNWNCVTANALRTASGEDMGVDVHSPGSLCLRRNDRSFAALYVPAHPEDVPDGERMGEFRGGGFIVMSWYKNHGGIDLIARADHAPRYGEMVITLQEAEDALDNLRSTGHFASVTAHAES